MFFLTPNDVTSERLIAPLRTLIWWEWLRAPEVERWQERQRVGDATDGRSGGVKRTAWESLLEMDRIDYRAGDMDQ